MKRIVVIFCTLIVTFNVMSQHRLDSLLVEYYNLSISSKNSNLYKESFFRIFPDNFQLFDSIYGYKIINEDSMYFSPLYSVSCEHIDRFYSTIDVVNKTHFYKKIINISQNGYWASDAVNCFQNNLRELLLNNTGDFIKELEFYSDIEIKNFWHFFFVNNIPNHPYIIELYKEVHKKIKLLGYNHILSLMEEHID